MKDLRECNSFVLFLQQCPVTMCSGRREEECVSWEYLPAPGWFDAAAWLHCKFCAGWPLGQ